MGKHSIVNEIKKVLNFPIIDVNQIAKEEKLLEKSQDVYEIDTQKLKKIIEKKISKPSLIVGHLAPYIISPKMIKKAIVLRKSPYELLSVYSERNYDERKIKENLGSEILGIITNDSLSTFGKEKIIQIDTTGSHPLSNSKRVVQAIRGDYESDSVDWLALVTQNNDLKKFFAY